MRLIRQLYIQVLIALVLAVALSIVAPATAMEMKSLSDAFIALLRMMLGPIIFCFVALGLTHVRNMTRIGRLALKALMYFEMMSTVGMALNFVMVNLLRSGVGLLATGLTAEANVARLTDAVATFTAVNFCLSTIPTTLVDAFGKGEILQSRLQDRLEGLNMPCLILGDRRDLLGRSADVAAVAARVPHAGHNRIDSGYLMSVQAPTAMSQTLAGFVNTKEVEP